jgi:hypothetical protein
MGDCGVWAVMRLIVGPSTARQYQVAKDGLAEAVRVLTRTAKPGEILRETALDLFHTKPRETDNCFYTRDRSRGQIGSSLPGNGVPRRRPRRLYAIAAW